MKKIFFCVLIIACLLFNLNDNVLAEQTDNSNTRTLIENKIIPVPDTFILSESVDDNSILSLEKFFDYERHIDPSDIYYSPQKKLNDFGISWASAVCRSAESYYRRSADTEDISIDLSEMHLAWFSYHTDGVEDYLGNIKNSGTSTTINGTDVFNIGGNPIMATFSIANGLGFVDESKFPYKSSYTQDEFNNYTKKENCYNPDYRLIDSKWFPLKNQNDILNAKRYIYYNGQLATYIHLDDDMVNYDEASLYYYHGDTITEDNKPNYGATIVGWDDTVEPDYFADYSDGPVPTNYGAWIVQCDFKDANDDKYPNLFYISYEEASIANSFAASFQIEKIDENNQFNTYQYDGNSGYNYTDDYTLLNDDGEDEYIYETYFYNVYEPIALESIERIGLYTFQNNLYVNLYVSYFAADKNPTIEEIMEHTGLHINNDHGKISCAGYHDYDVSYSHNFQSYQGTKMYVLIKLSSKTDEIKIALDGKTETNNIFNIKQTSYDTNPSNNIQSFVKTSNGVKSLYELEGFPARIKLFTIPTINAIYYVIPDGVDNPNIVDQFDENVMNEPILPANKDGFRFNGWYTNSTFTSKKLTYFPNQISDSLVLYPAFCQRILFDYDGEANDRIIHIEKYDSNAKAEPVDLLTNTVDAPSNKEFGGWKYTNKKGSLVTITDFFAPYLFEDAKLNGEDIICTPIWNTVTSTLPTNIVNDNLVDNQIVVLSTDKYSPGETSLFSLDSNELKNKILTNSGTALIWLESNAIKDQKFEDYKDYFEKEKGKVPISLFDINLFKQEKDETEGTKIQELTDSIDIEFDITNYPDLINAAKNNNLLVSQIHNGQVTSPTTVEYNESSKKIKFKVDKFSIFAFEFKDAPIDQSNPSGENNNKDNSDTQTKTDSNFKVPDTGIN